MIETGAKGLLTMGRGGRSFKATRLFISIEKIICSECSERNEALWCGVLYYIMKLSTNVGALCSGGSEED